MNGAPRPPGLDAEVGAKAVFGMASDAMKEEARKPKRGRGRPKKPDPLTEALSAPELCEYAVRIPFTLGATFAGFAPPDVRQKLIDLWAMSDEEAKVGGLALRALVLKHGGWIAEHLPEIVLGSVFLVGGGGRLVATAAIMRSARKPKLSKVPNPEPADKG